MALEQILYLGDIDRVAEYIYIYFYCGGLSCAS